MAYFFFSASLVMTQCRLISAPVAARVDTAPMGRALPAARLPVKKSQTSPSSTAPTAMALAQSMALPPPTATTASRRFCWQSLMPSRTEESLGLADTPSRATTCTPASASSFAARE